MRTVLSFKKKNFLVAEICKAHPSEKERNFSQILEATSKCVNRCKKMRLIGVRLTLTLFNKSPRMWKPLKFEGLVFCKLNVQ